MYFLFKRKSLRTRKKRITPKEESMKAKALVHERLAFFNQHYGYSINKIAIRNQKTRWGSCSSKGNLNFNYKIIYLPPEAQDYLIVHELVHLKEFNHSKRFWDLVLETIPNCKEIGYNLKHGKYIKL
jgi:predicted metal-dependent hydrolase